MYQIPEDGWEISRLLSTLQSVPAKKADTPVAVSVSNTTSQVDNHIYFYQHIDTDSVMAVINQLNSIDRSLNETEVNSRDIGVTLAKRPIYIHINSGGGSAIDGFNLHDAIRLVKRPVIAIVEGYAASAATLVASACSKTLMQENAYYMIHQVWSIMWGTYQEFQDEMKILNNMMDRIVNIYAHKTGVDVATLREMLRHDYWMDSQQALEQKFIDGIITPTGIRQLGSGV